MTWPPCPVCGGVREVPTIACTPCWLSVTEDERERIREAAVVDAPDFEEVVRSVFPTYLKAAER